jgi:hypothetical protein
MVTNRQHSESEQKNEGAQMKVMIKVAKGTGKVILALLTGILMPILIWVALGVALNQRTREKKLKPAAAPTMGEILTRAGLTIHDDIVVKHCWEILNCPPERHETCPTYVRRDIPFWVANGLGKGG